ncbi:MAG: hypothetical protein LBR93_05190, partial [Treponema sp.]|nr:hypothetical protein [Treponema sp.]
VPGRCYRITDKESGVSAGFGGDGVYQKELVEFFKGCDVLEFARGMDTDPVNPNKHSSIQESARLAEEAGVKMFCPVHGPANQIQQCREKVKEYYQGNTHWPRPLERLVVS